MKIREALLAESKSYAENTPQVTEGVLDCSLGENPYGYPECVEKALKKFDITKIAHYPHSHAAKDAIIQYWKGQADLSADNITLSDGSIDALYLINNMFLGSRVKVIGFIPTFTDMVVNCSLLGMEYVGVPLETSENYKANVDRLVEKIDETTTFVYMDMPNNPTGQIITLADIKKVLVKANSVGAGVVIDEAYGDFITKQESAISLLNDFDNLIVTRTFSKGFGLAGLRAGYILASKVVTKVMSKLNNPYTISELARELVAAAMEDEGYTTRYAEEFSSAKKTIEQVTGNNIKLLSTDYRVPICTLQHKSKDVNLQKILLDEGVLTVSGQDFEGLGQNFVRLRIPKLAETEKLISAIKKADQ